MKSKAYWAKRAVQRENEAYLKGTGLTVKLFEEYQRAGQQIRRDINDFYGKYATRHGLTYKEAIKALSLAENREWRATLEDYMARIAAESDPDIKSALTAQLDALSANSRISRLEALQGQINLRLNDLWDAGVRGMQETFGDIFTEGVYTKLYDLQSRTGFFAEISRVSEGMVQDVLSYPWSGAHFSERLWQNKQALIYHMRETLTQGLIQGKSISAMSKTLADKMGQSYKAAERLVLTETSHFHAAADLEAYKAAGVEEYEFMATLDSHTCEDCGPLDGRHYRLEDAREGINYPPMHVRCRCTTVEYDPEEALDWMNSGEPMPERMTYEEWREKQNGEHGEGYVEKSRAKAYNKARDKKQYERYKDLLGANAPSSFKEFQNIKYSDTSAWELIKSETCSKNYLQQQLSYIYNGEMDFIPSKTRFEKVITIAGPGAEDKIGDINRLVNTYGGSADTWKKQAGRVSSAKYVFDVHWYECEDGLQHDVKLKNRKEKR